MSAVRAPQAPLTSLPPAQQAIFTRGWEDAAADVMTPAMRRRIEAAGLAAHLAQMAQDEAPGGTAA